MRYLLLLLIASLAFAGDAPPNPLKPTMDSYESAVTKAFSDYMKAVEKVNDKTLKDLDSKLKSAMRKGDLEYANAIKAQMTQISSGKVSTEIEKKLREEMSKDAAELLGPSTNVDPLVGKWLVEPNNGWEFKSDGTGTRLAGLNNYPAQWKKVDNTYTVTCMGSVRPLVFINNDTIQVHPGVYTRSK